MKYLKIKGTTKITGVIGWPVEHTLSPLMHNTGFAHLGLDFCYLPFPVKPDDLSKAIEGLCALNFRGINVTIPHKERIINFLDELKGPARLMGAVNTVINERGKLIGYNTDGPGFIEFLKNSAHFDPRKKNVVIFGAGGAGRAVSFMLVASGANKIFFFDTDYKKCHETKKILSRNFPGRVIIFDINLEKDLKKILSDADLLINATPAGMPPFEKISPLSGDKFDYLKNNCLVVDLIYNPKKTIFLNEAHKRKLKAFNGLGLLVWQGVLSFELFTGRKINPQIFFNALNIKKSG